MTPPTNSSPAPAAAAETVAPLPAAGWDAVLDRFAGQPVLVVGETFLDGWYRGPSRGLSREAPVPVVTVQDEEHAPGAAANTARALTALGAEVRFLTVVGDDRDGEHVRTLLAAAGVSVDHVMVQAGRRTVAKRRVLSDAHLLTRFDAGDTGPVDPATATELTRRLDAAVQGCAAVVACDYAAGLFTPDLIPAIAAAAHRHDLPLIVDAHDPARWAEARPFAVKPDAEELEPLLGRLAGPTNPVNDPLTDPVTGPLTDFRRDRVATVIRHATGLLDRTGAQLVLATLDRDGALVLSRDAPAYRVHADPIAGAHGAGAGDVFLAAFTLASMSGASPRAAAEAGGAAAAVAVRRPGTAVCELPALRDRLVSGGARLLPVERLAACAETHRALGRRLVFTNGCFDVLHRGHVAYLTAAKALGDVLIVGLNSDASVRGLKGPDRPVNPLADRAAVLAALSAVDHLVVFDGDTPADLLRLVRPDVYVKGGDYTEDMLREAPLVHELGGEVRIVDYVEDHSTSGLLDRVRRGPRSTPLEPVRSLLGRGVPAGPDGSA